MDPLSQACFGASLSQSASTDKSRQLSALVIGALAGMAPDLDVLIQSPGDPLLFLEYHRQFTHSLIFIPVGALICALVFYHLFKQKLSFFQIYIFSLLGYATHGLLDACTSYGTQLFWPFSNERVAWSTVSIVDPFFTLPILILIILAVYKKNKTFARAAFTYAIIFLSLGLIQKQRATDALYAVAEERNHNPSRVHVKPSFANRHVWKIVYEHDDRYYVDAVKILWDSEIIQGTSIKKLNLIEDLPWLNHSSQQAKDIERFRWFSDNFLALSPTDPELVIDVRYSFIPNTIIPLWGITLNRDDVKKNVLGRHVQFTSRRALNEKIRKQFLEMLF